MSSKREIYLRGTKERLEELLQEQAVFKNQLKQNFHQDTFKALLGTIHQIKEIRYEIELLENDFKIN